MANLFEQKKLVSHMTDLFKQKIKLISRRAGPVFFHISILHKRQNLLLTE